MCPRVFRPFLHLHMNACTCMIDILRSFRRPHARTVCKVGHFYSVGQKLFGNRQSRCIVAFSVFSRAFLCTYLVCIHGQQSVPPDRNPAGFLCPDMRIESCLN